jgi:hypothetical protein
VLSILNNVKDYYRENGISAFNFHCPNYHNCKNGCAEFTKAREPFIGTKYDARKKDRMPRILFVSLDSGAGRRLARERTAEQHRNWAECRWRYTGRDRNKHWFQTHHLAWTILRNFDVHARAVRDSLDEHFRVARSASDDVVTLQVRKYVTPYFAATNSAKCSQNRTAKRQAEGRLFRNCRPFLAGELVALQPDIIVTQGATAKSSVEFGLDEHSDMRRIKRLAKSAYEIEIDGRRVLWLHTYHARNYGKFHNERKRRWSRFAEIASTWYRELQ